MLPVGKDAQHQRDVGLAAAAISARAREVVVEGEDAEDGHPVAWCSGKAEKELSNKSALGVTLTIKTYLFVFLEVSAATRVLNFLTS